ncbi:MAG: hypothetical protein PHV28_10515 [Kiritimatiellae bacterium]|nr:hypothetical protein [Kiritimatiellia bacterium]
MDGNLFCGGPVEGGPTFAGLPCFLILTAYALCLAVRIWERGGFCGFRARLRETWTSWPPALRVLMVVLVITCVSEADKPGGGTNNPAASAQQPAMPEEQEGGVQPPGGSLAGVPGGYAVLQALEGGSVTNGWWAQEGRDGTDSDGDGMPDAWERVFGLAPADPSNAAGDPDRDTVSNLGEFLNRTHPRRRDTDGDGMPDSYESAHLSELCPWTPDDMADADADGLDNFHEMALGAEVAEFDSNCDGRTDGEEAGEGVDPTLALPDRAAYGTARISVRVDGLQAARRAGVAVGHILHSGVSQRTYALAAGYRYPLSVVDLDPDNTNACAGMVRLGLDNGTFIHGFTNEFPVTFPLSTNVPACPPGTEVTVVGIDLDIPDITWVWGDNSASFPVSARFLPEGETIPGTPQWSAGGGTVAPESGGMETWATVYFPEEQEQGALALQASGIGTNGLPEVTVTVGDRDNGRTVYPPVDPDPDDPDPWNGRRYIARSSGDDEPVDLTYALQYGTNAVPFSWHGHPDDTVLEWTVSGDGPRFVADGQESSRVRYTKTVDVLPKGTEGNFTITAKCQTPEGGIVTRTAKLRVIWIVAEPVCVFYPGGGGPLINSSGFRVGDEVVFRFVFSDNVDGSHVYWLKIGDAAVWSGTPVETGKGDIVLRGSQPGAGGIEAWLENGYGIPWPKLDFKVFAVSAPIPVHVGILCDTNGEQSVTLDAVNTKIGLASNIFRQVGIGFYRASVTWITNHSFYVSDPQSTPGYLYTNDLILAQIQQSDGLEVYFCPWDMVQADGAQGVWKEGGILIAKNKADIVVAHELGHAFGWNDIYGAGVNGTVSQTRLPQDWNNGPGPEEYYTHGMEQTDVIDLLLMSSGGGVDIPSGRVYGRSGDDGSLKLTKVGESDMTTRQPVSQ